MAFSTKIKGHHHVQGNVQVYNARIPVDHLVFLFWSIVMAPKGENLLVSELRKGSLTRVGGGSPSCDHGSLFPCSYGSKLTHSGTAGFSPCVHLPGFHFGYIFFAHSHVGNILSFGGFSKKIVVRFDHPQFGLDILVAIG